MNFWKTWYPSEKNAELRPTGLSDEGTQSTGESGSRAGYDEALRGKPFESVDLAEPSRYF